MRHPCKFTAAVLATLVVTAVVVPHGQEFVRVLRNGEQVTLSAFGGRPVDLVAGTLVERFGVAVNVEDPVYLYSGDVHSIGITRSGAPLLVPNAALLEMAFDVRSDGSLADVEQVVRDLVDTANSQLPFQYRVERDRDVFTLVATRTHDAQGRLVALNPILDHLVTIPRGTRKIYEHISLLMQALQQQTGLQIGCCEGVVGGRPWGSTVVSFEAHDEPARSALLRLLRAEPADRLVRSPQDGRFHVVKSDPARDHWRYTMRCQPAQPMCFINISHIPEEHQPLPTG